MAAPIAAAGVGKLVEMMAQPLANEASLLFNFREDFQWVARELNLMKAYLEDADQKSTQGSAVKQWIGELRDVVFDAEDIMDECAAKSLSNPFSCSGLIFKYKIGRRIRDLKGRMKSIDADATRLQLLRGAAATEQASTSSSGAEKWKRPCRLESNARPVAIEPKVDEILGLLGDAAHPVIAVVGMGGVGKTFLLQNVYNDPRTKMMFDNKCIWLSISQTYTLQKLQSDIAYKLGLGDVVVAGHLTEQTAADQIHESLNGKKFLIVLDDVWRATEEDNLIERLGIPIANTQCKIVVTTRSIDVCTRMNASSIYHMEVLQEEDSWDLFCLYAFYPDNRPPPHLKEIARQIERVCGKLPLALKTVGALAASMANRESTGQWEFMFKKLKAVRKPDPIMEILQLSYDFLPAHIKPCFLYFAFFGEDEEIDVEYLLNLWRAEGFVPEGDDWREIGLDCYYQLSNLCLVERKNGWLSEYCKIHDLVRDLAIYICRENKCAFTLDEGCTKYSSSCTQYLSQPDKSSGCRRMFLAKQHIKDDQISDSSSFQQDSAPFH